MYYGDRTTFSDRDGEWRDAPFLNVAALAVPEPSVKRQIMTGDFYVLAPWNTVPHSPELAGLLDHLRHVSGFGGPLADLTLDGLAAAGVKLGRMYDNAVWRDLWQWIVGDADLTWG